MSSKRSSKKRASSAAASIVIAPPDSRSAFDALGFARCEKGWFSFGDRVARAPYPRNQWARRKYAVIRPAIAAQTPTTPQKAQGASA